jgi:hypothetical protein
MVFLIAQYLGTLMMIERLKDWQVFAFGIFRTALYEYHNLLM